MSVSPASVQSLGVAARDGGAAAGPPTTVVLGGARSGKSRFAESLVTAMAEDLGRAGAQGLIGAHGERALDHALAQDRASGAHVSHQEGAYNAWMDSPQARCPEGAPVSADADLSGALSITYIATSARVPGDVAFAERIALHQIRRPASWGLIEADHDLAAALRQADTGPEAIVLIDCLTLWLTRLLCPMDADAPRPDWEARLADFDKALAESRARVVLVSNEIGMGVVPMGAVTRLFVDELGRLNQRIAAACDQVVLTVAGLSLVLKDAAPTRQGGR